MADNILHLKIKIECASEDVDIGEWSAYWDTRVSVM